MSDVTGYRLTTNVSSDQLAIDMASEIDLLEPSSQPLCVYSRQAGKEATIAPKFNWMTDKSRARYTQINNSGGYNTSATSIVVDSAASIAKWDTLRVTRTGELMRVTDVSTNTLTVVRGVGNSGTGLAINDDDEVLIVASAQPENDLAKTPRSNNPAKITNYTQIFREPFAESGTMQATGNQVNPLDWNLQSKKAGIEHAKDIEYALLFGKKDAATVSGAELRTTGGIIDQIATNQTDAGGTLTEDEWNAFMATVMRYNSSKKALALGSATAVSALNKFPASKQITRNDETTYGMNVTRFASPFGAINLVYHPLFEGGKGGGYLLVVDLDEIVYRYLSANGVSRDTKILPNRQEESRDGHMDEYLTEAGNQWGYELRHGLLTGITG
jgi:hypothetical protein